MFFKTKENLELPAGNVWDRGNSTFQAEYASSPYNITVVTEPNEVELQLLEYLKREVVREGWQFQSLVEMVPIEGHSDDEAHSELAYVFTHPLRTALTDHVSQDDIKGLVTDNFAQEDYIFGEEVEPNHPVNKVLQGTNWVVKGMSVGFSSVIIDYQKRNLWPQGKTWIRRVYDQPGVGLVRLGLATIDSEVEDINRTIEQQMSELVTPLRKNRRVLNKLHTAEPKNLFVSPYPCPTPPEYYMGSLAE